MNEEKIAYRITAVPERRNNALLELSSLSEADALIYWDKAHNGNIWNKFRVYEDILSSDYTHVNMCDDDIEFVPNYREAVQAVVHMFPDAIFTFYNSKVGYDEYGFVKMFYMAGGSCVIPKSILPAFLKFYENNLAGYHWDDTAMSIFAMLNDIPVYLVNPKIMNVIQDMSKSMLKFRHGKGSPPNLGYIGKEIDVERLKQSGVIAVSNKINLHLKDGHPLKELCRRKGARPW